MSSILINSVTAEWVVRSDYSVFAVPVGTGFTGWAVAIASRPGENEAVRSGAWARAGNPFGRCVVESPGWAGAARPSFLTGGDHIMRGSRTRWLLAALALAGLG